MFNFMCKWGLFTVGGWGIASFIYDILLFNRDSGTDISLLFWGMGSGVVIGTGIALFGSEYFTRKGE